MCGIVGFIDQKKETSQVILEKMRDSINYRGPDSVGFRIYEKESYHLGLGHRRLSILDLSSLGSQPMYYKHLTLIHNGEIYNFASIKEELYTIGYKFDSHTDTEVIIKAFHAWGVDCVEKFRGMFAFSIYDRNRDELYIFRDRAGIKPLYYYKSNEIFLFGSELKSFYQHPKFKKNINKDALPYYFRFGYIPAPLTIFQDTYKLQAGHYLIVDCKNNSYKEKLYWSVEKFYLEKKSTNNEEEILIELEEILLGSFKLRMISDVPVGIFLSGGIDSSLITALLSKEIKNPLKTFTIGFENANYNEAPFAKEIAEYLGTEHTEYYCTNQDMLTIIKDLPTMYDEPFGDSSAIPTLLVSKLAKEKVSVVLSGDGGDEAFVGYSKYFALDKIASLQNSPIRKALLTMVTNLLNEKSVEIINNLLPTSKKQKNIKDKYQKFKNALNSQNISEMFINASSYVDNKTLDKVLLNNKINISLTDFSIFKKTKSLPELEQMMLCDYKTYMANDILTKVDRASMNVSIEAREPLIDHKIIEFIAKVPTSIKYKENQGKYLLKKILYKYIPKELIERPKSGFQVPLYEWLKDELKEELEYFLSRERLNKSAIYNVDEVLTIKEHLYQGKEINLSLLWFILMFEMWKDKWL
jgi:asparagine synthase (glutamine-hydrolysing)